MINDYLLKLKISSQEHHWLNLFTTQFESKVNVSRFLFEVVILRCATCFWWLLAIV